MELLPSSYSLHKYHNETLQNIVFLLYCSKVLYKYGISSWQCPFLWIYSTLKQKKKT